MNQPRSTSHQLRRATGELLVALAMLAPIVLGAWLPLLWAVALMLALLVPQALFIRLRWLRSVHFVKRVRDGVLLGTTVGFLYPWNHGWGLLLGPCWTVAWVILLFAVDDRLWRLAPPQPLPAVDPERNRLLTPQGEVVHRFPEGEICMGGPTLCGYQFPDGVWLSGLDEFCRFSSDGRFFATRPSPRSPWGLLLLDRQQRRVYMLKRDDEPWELDDLDDEVLQCRNEPSASDPKGGSGLRGRLADADAIDLVPQDDLWVLPENGRNHS